LPKRDCWYWTVLAKGKAGHAAREEGVNAIYQSLQDIEWFRSYRFPKVSDTLGESKNVSNVINAGQAHNQVPTECKFTVDIRVTDSYSLEEVLETVKENVKCEVTPRSLRMRSSGISLTHPLVVAGKSLGKKLYGSPTTSDQALMPVDSIKMGPGDSARSHSADEFIYVAEIEAGIKLLPGYTHLQVAMPSSFGLWFGAYAESLTDDLITLQAAYQIANKNPLGSAAGYGSSFPLNRTLTTSLLGFADLNYNVVYAQMGRGKTEKIMAQAMSNVAATLGKLAMDATLFLNQNFSFISFPDELTTGSSIMPHKKNPDVFELIRAKCNSLQSLPNEIALLIANLPSGYHRDLQLLKEKLFPAIQTLKDCLRMTHLMLSAIEVTDNILADEKYKYLFSVEEVNKLVLAGMPFRDAYKKVGLDIEQGKFSYSTYVNHTHEGSIGNLMNDQIKNSFEKIIAEFNFQKAHLALESLTK
jgi:argininosuccinate lyase